MARSLRNEFLGAVYHVTCGGNERRPVRHTVSRALKRTEGAKRGSDKLRPDAKPGAWRDVIN